MGADLGGALVIGAAPVQRLDRALVLAAQAEPGQLIGVEGVDELVRGALPPGERGVRTRCSRRPAAAVRARGCRSRRSCRGRPAAAPPPPASPTRSRPGRSARPGRRAARTARSGTAACSGRSTIGASVPSMSVRIAVRAGSARSASSRAARASPLAEAVSPDTASSIARWRPTHSCDWPRSARWRASSAASSGSAAGP